MKLIPLAAAIFLAAASANAHSVVVATQPASGAVLSAMPQNLEIEFAKPIRITRVKITRGDDSWADLDLGDENSFQTLFELPLPNPGAGLYRIEWRGLSSDGHAMKGAFTFQVQ